MKTKIAITFEVEKRQLTQSALEVPLNLLDKHDIKATFFILGRVADRNPAIPEEILSRGHELGCHGYAHDPYDKKNLDDLENDVKKGTKAVSKLSDIIGFRAPYFRPHKRLATFLEDSGYRYDSSVPSKRFDLFLGRSNNPSNIFAPMKPYCPSRDNIFKKGDSEILEIPLPCFLLPPIGVTLRNMGLNFFNQFAKFVNCLSNFIMFDIHVWEFIEEYNESVRCHSQFFHRKNRGNETAIMFDRLLNHLQQLGTFVLLSDLVDKKCNCII